MKEEKSKRSAVKQMSLLQTNNKLNSRSYVRVSAHLKESTLRPELQKIAANLILDQKCVIYTLYQLTSQEETMIDAIAILLHENSQISDCNKKDYYSGNKELLELNFGSTQAVYPKLFLTYGQITKAYTGRTRISGKNVQDVREILQNLATKRFLISFEEKNKDKTGALITTKLEMLEPLITLGAVTETIENEDAPVKSTTIELIRLNPIFIRQINSKYILLPHNHILRLKLAYGNTKVPLIVIKFINYLLQIHSGKRYENKISKETLYRKIAYEAFKANRQKRICRYLESAINVAVKCDILISCEESEKYYIIKLNPKLFQPKSM